MKLPQLIFKKMNDDADNVTFSKCIQPHLARLVRCLNSDNASVMAAG